MQNTLPTALNLLSEIPLLQKAFDPYLRADQLLARQIKPLRLQKLVTPVKEANVIKAGANISTWTLIFWAMASVVVGVVLLSVGVSLPLYLAYSNTLGSKSWITPKWLEESTGLLVFIFLGFVSSRLANRLIDIILDRNILKDFTK